MHRDGAKHVLRGRSWAAPLTRSLSDQLHAKGRRLRKSDGA